MIMKIGEVSFITTINIEPNVIKEADTIRAGRDPDLSIQRPAIGAIMTENNPKASMLIPV
ncbi:hypothetical protein D3C76_1550760 [compost metagenome]